jgi:DNA modification methylase
VAEPKPSRKRRGPTSTSAFGVSRRESHDSSGFYSRFELPEFDTDGVPVRAPDTIKDAILLGDASDMSRIPDDSVALVVTSPPYYAGKAYEEDMSRGEVPSSYLEYLEMLRRVFAECKRVLEPGGRIAVNVANLGRKPYRSLSSDVIRILQDDLRLWLRGEIIWVKARGATNSTAWGTFQQPGNPVLRDLTERIVVASKGRLDRALPKEERAKEDYPSTATIFRDEFLEFTQDIWEFPPESATRVGHPAPFPVELPQRLINLYTYENDLVLDPFMGSGTTAIAAVRNKRHYVGFELDEAYKLRAEERITEEAANTRPDRPRIAPTKTTSPETDLDDPASFQARATADGRRAQELAGQLLEHAGFTIADDKVKLPCGVEVNFTAFDQQNHLWYFDVSGAFTSGRPGLKRTDTLWKALGRASVIHHWQKETKGGPEGFAPLVLITTDRPKPGSRAGAALRLVLATEHGVGSPIYDVIEFHDAAGLDRLKEYASLGHRALPTKK